jgi:hypothetical protein
MVPHTTAVECGRKVESAPLAHRDTFGINGEEKAPEESIYLKLHSNLFQNTLPFVEIMFAFSPGRTSGDSKVRFHLRYRRVHFTDDGTADGWEWDSIILHLGVESEGIVEDASHHNRLGQSRSGNINYSETDCVVIRPLRSVA